MSTTTDTPVPAGWYSDPVEFAEPGLRTQCRWWNGAEWTDHVAPLPTPMSPDVSYSAAGSVNTATTTDVRPAPATVSPHESARAAELMPLHSARTYLGSRRPLTVIVDDSPPPVSLGHFDPPTYERFGNLDRLAPPPSLLTIVTAYQRPKHRAHTVSVWLMATMPVTQALLMFWAFSTTAADSTPTTRALAIAFPFVLYAALAGQDSRLLTASGHRRTAPWIIALFAPPIYLAVRGARVARSTGSLAWPLMVWILTQLAVLGAWFVLDPGAPQTLLDTLT